MSAGAATLTTLSAELKPQLTRVLQELTHLIPASLNAHVAPPPDGPGGPDPHQRSRRAAGPAALIAHTVKKRLCDSVREIRNKDADLSAGAGLRLLCAGETMGDFPCGRPRRGHNPAGSRVHGLRRVSRT